MKDYDYVTVWLPYKGQTQGHRDDINDDCREWLSENVGLGAQNFKAWLLDHEDDTYTWCYAGVDHSPNSDFNEYQRKFHFKDINKATLFKLTWGG